MKTKSLFIMIGIAVVLSTLMVVQHFVSFMTVEEHKVERRIEPNWVRGASLMVKEKPYTLNFDQQNELLKIINQSDPFTLTISQGKPPIDAITIYRFPKEQEIVINSKGTVGNKIVYQAEGIAQGALLIEKEAGALKKLVNSLDTK